MNSPITYKVNMSKTRARPILRFLTRLLDYKCDSYNSVSWYNLNLFAKEMKYGKGFRVIRMSDLGYDNNGNFLYMNTNNRYGSIPRCFLGTGSPSLIVNSMIMCCLQILYFSVILCTFRPKVITFVMLISRWNFVWLW